MGRYIQWDAVTNRYSDAAKIAGASDIGSAYLLGAEYEIDARLATLYSVPFTPCPPVVQDLCTDLTYYKMTMRQETSKSVKEYIDERIKAILGGSMSLVNSGGVLVGTIAGVGPYYSSEGDHSSFGPDAVPNWRVSSAWMETAQADRGDPL